MTANLVRFCPPRSVDSFHCTDQWSKGDAPALAQGHALGGDREGGSRNATDHAGRHRAQEAGGLGSAVTLHGKPRNAEMAGRRSAQVQHHHS